MAREDYLYKSASKIERIKWRETWLSASKADRMKMIRLAKEAEEKAAEEAAFAEFERKMRELGIDL